LDENASIELPDQIVSEVQAVIEAGTFANPSDVVRAALLEFISHHRHELIEQQQSKDIAWALNDS